jgi:hypothetical protein
MRAGTFAGRTTGVVVEGEFDGVGRDSVGGGASGSLSVAGNELGTDEPNNNEVSVM